jgi:hypothetical protein
MNQAIENTFPSWEDFKVAIPTGLPGLFALRHKGEILVARRGGVWYRPRDVEAERATKALAEHEATQRTQIGNYPTCDECNEQHSQDVACEDVTERRMSEEQKQEYRLDQQDEVHSALIPEIPASTFIDITPVGCQTPEGNIRVLQAQQEWDSATHELANYLKNVVDDIFYTDGDKFARAEMYSELQTLIGIREVKQEAFLRAVAGR